MKEITYTFIIPHHNCPDLLDRCLSSIPQRDDIQIIVVDDNSDADKKPIECGRSEVEYIYIDKNYTKGAGRARNIGLSKAKGKWLLFPDSDDYYNEGFIKILDLYKETTIDVLFFNFTFIDGESGDILPPTKIQQTIEVFDQSQEKEDIIRYKNNSPWSKMVSHDFVKQIHAYYEEAPNGNDILFSLWIGHKAKKIAVNNKSLYNYVVTPNSLGTKKQSPEELMCRVMHIVKHNAYNNYLKRKEWNANPLKYIVSQIYRMKVNDTIAFIKVLMLRFPSLFIHKNEWVNIIFGDK
ncbi:MAG: glycosyltransferase family 2 protein [Paludibacteraceae bacterium]|nr:glycosyltransferase family 2 protein [Paludibacteraceae bacterium]